MQMEQRPKPARHDSLLARLFADEIRAWHGTGRLSTVFWRYGVLNTVVLMVLYATTVYLNQRVAEEILLIAFVPYSVWILVSIWRCASATPSLWGELARFLTIAWAANLTMILFFRQLELLF